MRTYTLKVCNIKTETEDTITISFKQPGLKKIKYLPGQYLTLIFRINGRRFIRPYSFSSSPGIDAHLEVTVKRVPGGVISNHIIDQVKVDDLIEVMEPMGDFILDETILPTKTHIVLWGAGSGITPLMSIAKYALHKNIASHVTLVYGNRNTECVIFGDKIKQLHEQFDNFSAWQFYTQAVISNDNPLIVQGRIDPGKVLAVMQKEGDLKNTIHYICGPYGLKESVKLALSNLGVDLSNIYTEDFEVVRNPADFDDITTQMVKLSKGGEVTTIEVTKGKSILEAGLDSMIELSYSCQTGNCLVCKGRVINGSVKMIGVSKLPDGLMPDEYLLCSSFPLSENIEIEVD